MVKRSGKEDLSGYYICVWFAIKLCPRTFPCDGLNFD